MLWVHTKLLYSIAAPLTCTWSNESFSKTIFCVQNLLLRWLIFALILNLLLFVINCWLYLLNLYSLLHFRFLTSHNINVPNAYIFGASFFGVHRLNPFVCNLMSVYEIRSFVDIFSIWQPFLTIKQIGDKGFFKIFNI